MAEVDGVMPDLEEAVRSRHAKGAYTAEQNLCCPATYNPELLAAIPDEVLERDYGCGDPTHHLHPGETVLDLGSGAGKVCFLACQVVGPSGQVHGVDMTDEMLAVARRNAPEVARRVGYANIEFRKGKIQDLALDLEKLEAWLEENPVRTVVDLGRLESAMGRLRATEPLIPEDSIDVVVSNCVLNLVRPEDKQKLFARWNLQSPSVWRTRCDLGHRE